MFGVLSGFGRGSDRLWRGLCAGVPAFGPWPPFEAAGLRFPVAASVPDACVSSAPPDPDRAARFLHTVIIDALHDAGAGPDFPALAAHFATSPSRVGLVAGTSASGIGPFCEGIATGRPRNAGRYGDAAARVAASLGHQGPVLVPCNVCASGAIAIAEAAALIHEGSCDVVVAAGFDALEPFVGAGFASLNALAQSPRPFRRGRPGLTLGEGAAALVLAPLRTLPGSKPGVSRRERGRLLGAGLSSDAWHLTAPDPQGRGVAAAIQRALDDAGLAPEAVGSVNLHGTGTLYNGAVLTVAGLNSGVLPPTGGLIEPDPACPGRHIFGTGLEMPVGTALVHAFGFGGLDGVIALTGPESVGARPSRPERGAHRAVSETPMVITRAVSAGPEGLLRDQDCRGLLDPTGTVPPFDPTQHLDSDRVRRLDLFTRILTLVVQQLLDGVSPTEAGVITGNTWGAIDGTARFLGRMVAHGGRTPDAFLFPNLVPSSPVAHASLYVGARGPVFATPDLGLPTEAAFHGALELLRAGEAPRFVVAAHSDVGEILGASYLPMSCPDASPSLRSAGVLLERLDTAVARGAAPIACVADAVFAEGEVEVAPLPGARATSIAIATGDSDAATLARGWPLLSVPGRYEISAANALVVAVALLGGGSFKEILLVGKSGRRWSRVRLIAAENI